MKGILIVDMPKNCAECTLRTSLEANYFHCIATLPRLKIEPMTAHINKEHKCPLKPMPEKNTWDITKNGHVTEYAEGWNACIEEIMGETE